MGLRTPTFRGQSAEVGGQRIAPGPVSPLPSAPCPPRSGQEGFTLAALIVILTIIAIVIAYTVPEQWSMVMKRERERQTIFVMKQYARGIRNFQRKHNRALPTSLQQLQEAKSPRLIRHGGKWACPLTGSEEDWILVPPNAVGGNAVGGNPGGGNPGGGRGRGRGQGRGQEGARGVATLKPPSELNPEASPADYIGQFVGVRPRASGKSFIALNGVEDYGQWVYTIQDLENEIAMRQLALAAK